MLDFNVEQIVLSLLAWAIYEIAYPKKEVIGNYFSKTWGKDSRRVNQEVQN